MYFNCVLAVLLVCVFCVSSSWCRGFICDPGHNNIFGDAFFKQYMITGTHIALYFITVYSKTCLNRPLKIDKIKILMTNGSSMMVESIVECKPIWCLFESGRFRQVLLYNIGDA